MYGEPTQEESHTFLTLPRPQTHLSIHQNQLHYQKVRRLLVPHFETTRMPADRRTMLLRTESIRQEGGLARGPRRLASVVPPLNSRLASFPRWLWLGHRQVPAGYPDHPFDTFLHFLGRSSRTVGRRHLESPSWMSGSASFWVEEACTSTPPRDTR